MDPNTLPAHQFELPKPQATPGKESLAPAEGDQAVVQATEQRNMEQPAVMAPTMPSQAAASQTAASAAQPAAHGVIPVLPAASSPVIDDVLLAEDGDLIEKAWVQKAKAIVERTKADPYTQNREINKVKKEYIQKRYQKDVKLSDE